VGAVGTDMFRSKVFDVNRKTLWALMLLLIVQARYGLLRCSDRGRIAGAA